MSHQKLELQFEKTTPIRIHTGHDVFKAKMGDKAVFYKSNKRNNPDLSLYEVALSHLITAFLMPMLTPKYALIKEGERVVGLVSEHMSLNAKNRESQDAAFYSLSYHGKEGAFLFEQKTTSDPPMYFFNEYPPGFFAHLYHASKNSHTFDCDMNSLASVLCSSYTLEEDDLHKGNLGFYVVARHGRKTIVFFKIDHDLLLSDSLMSYYEFRIANWSHGEHAFKITARDLNNFPTLTDSKNHYWPTRRCYLVDPNDSRVYVYMADISAFSELSQDVAFKQAKWRAWLKHALVNPDILTYYLERSLDSHDLQQKMTITLIAQLTLVRLARLRAVLFSIQEFRLYVQSIDVKIKNEIMDELLNGIEDNNTLNMRLVLEKQLALLQCQDCIEGDTPLHIAIRLGNYRYDETWSSFKDDANRCNSLGETPLDVAVKLAEKTLSSNPHYTIDPQKNPFAIINHLLSHGVNRTRCYREFKHQYPNVVIHAYFFHKQYLECSKKATTSEELIHVFRQLSEDNHLTLKMKKQISIACMRVFLMSKEAHPSLIQTIHALTVALNGDKRTGHLPRPELQFIRQLRSRLWMIRILRGLLGGTSTQVELNRLMDETKKTIVRPRSCCSCFFWRKNDALFGHRIRDSVFFSRMPF